MTSNIFESIKKINEYSQEYWSARDLMGPLGYIEWRKFEGAINRAKDSCKNSKQNLSDHFVSADKLVLVGSDAKRVISDYHLSRYACYLIAQNGDPRKEEIALAQTYFATQTRKQELIGEKQKILERVTARKKLSETERKFGGVLAERGIQGKQVGEIKSAGDEALFGRTTHTLKKNFGIDQVKPLADFLPTISIKAKDLAMEMTTFNTQKKDLKSKYTVKTEHVGNNSSVRKMLNENGIYPERLPVEEDIKKLEKNFTEGEIDNYAGVKLLELEKLEIDLRNVVDESELQRIRDLIQNNQGNSKLLIFYGSKKKTRVFERQIQINSEIISGLRQYLVNN